VNGRRRASDDDDLHRAGESGVDGLQKPLELLAKEGLHYGLANLSNVDRKLSTPMFMR
jgi:hypothetical protein